MGLVCAVASNIPQALRVRTNEYLEVLSLYLEYLEYLEVPGVPKGNHLWLQESAPGPKSKMTQAGYRASSWSHSLSPSSSPAMTTLGYGMLS